MNPKNIFDFSEHFNSEYSAILSSINNNYNSLIASLRIDKNNIAIPKQTHSSNVKYVSQPGIYNDTDGLIANKSDIILSLRVADCVPIYILDKKNDIHALIHSGWRGTLDKIVFNAIEMMYSYGSKSSDIKIFLGPSIGICCYEVNKDIADNFHYTSKIRINKSKWKVGLKEQIIIDLVHLGIKKKKILKSNVCTLESYECHSFRRDGNKSGRMISLMGKF